MQDTSAYTALPHDLARLIAERRWAELAALSDAWPEAEIVAPELVDTLLELGKPDRVLLFRALPEIAAEALAALGGEARDALLRDLSDPDDRTFLLGELPGRATQRLNLLSPDDLAEARQLLGYPEESVGRLMTLDALAVRPELDGAGGARCSCVRTDAQARPPTRFTW